MNDFTKEELWTISQALRHIRKQGVEIGSKINEYDLEMKVDSILNNYCEHPFLAVDHDFSPMRCTTCLEIVDDE